MEVGDFICDAYACCADLWDGGPALARIDPPAIEALFNPNSCTQQLYLQSNGTVHT